MFDIIIEGPWQGESIFLFNGVHNIVAVLVHPKSLEHDIFKRNKTIKPKKIIIKDSYDVK